MKEILVWILIIVTLPAMIELALLSFGALIYRESKKGPLVKGSLALIVPAHNEEANIKSTIKSFLQCPDPEKNSDIIVVADNCSDRTAEIATELGAKVLVRKSDSLRGKNWALRFAFETLKDYDYYFVVDADSLVESNLIEEVRREFGAGADAVQVADTVKVISDNPRSSLMNLAFTAFNVVRPKGRAFWGISAGIFGNGFALSAETLRRVPYETSSIAEDLEYHLKLVNAGLRVTFSPDSAVCALMPTSTKAATTQRVRWEGGRLSVFKANIGTIFKSIKRGHLKIIEPLLDLTTLPLAFVSLIALAGALFGGGVYFYSLLAVVAFHVFVALIHMKKMPSLKSLSYIPVYCLWKLGLLTKIWRSSKKGVPWVRTERETQDEL